MKYVLCASFLFYTATLGCSSTSLHGISPAEYVPAENKDGIVIYSAGCDALFVDPKDQRLKEALALLDDRIGELPRELGADSVPVPLIKLGLDVLASRMSLRAGYRADADPSMGPPFYAQLTLHGSTGQDLGKRAMEIGSGFGIVGESDPAMHGLHQLNGAPMPAFCGNTEVGGEASFVVSLNDVLSEGIELGSLDLPPDVEPVFAYKFDMAQYAEALEGIIGMQGIDFGGANPLELMKLGGSSIVGGYGYGADRSYTTARYIGYVPAVRANGMMPEAPLRMQTLRLVPEDATYAAVGSVNFSGIPDMVRMVIASMGEDFPLQTDPFDMVTAMTGIDLEQDVFDHLGGAWGFYLSDSTGGGGWLSAVGFIEVADEEGLTSTLDELTMRFALIAEAESRGYVKIRHAEYEGVKLTTLGFAGLPIPLEITHGVHAGHLFLGLGPQAVVSAMQQAGGGSTSLLDNARFQEFAGRNFEGVYAVSFMDMPRFAAEGYGLTSMLCTAITNGMSSPSAPDRYVGSIMPAYNDFTKGCKAAVSLTRIVGDDMVTVSQADRSVLVNLSGTLGFLGPLPLVAMAAIPGAVFAGRSAVRAPMAAPVIAHEHEHGSTSRPTPVPAEHLHAVRIARVHADLTAIKHALDFFAINSGGEYPGSLKALLIPDDNGQAYLRSPDILEDPWGNPYQYRQPNPDRPHPAVYTLGSDGQAGGEGEAADMSTEDAH